MVRSVPTHSAIGEEEQQLSSLDKVAEVRPLRSAATEFATSLGWLPGTPSSDTFSKRCQKLAAAFDAIFEGVDAAFAKAPDSGRSALAP